jgi:putative endonuclease
MATRETQQRRAREQAGRRAEASAALWLRLKGYRILDRRARTPHGEIDLVVLRGNILAFVEVKARARLEAALEAATPELRSRVERAARMWAGRRRGMELRNWRFDVIAIVPGRMPHHVRDAWRPES